MKIIRLVDWFEINELCNETDYSFLKSLKDKYGIYFEKCNATEILFLLSSEKNLSNLICQKLHNFLWLVYKEKDKEQMNRFTQKCDKELEEIIKGYLQECYGLNKG